MKIVLVNPNYKSYIITPPLGLGYLAPYLKENGVEAKIIDGLRDNLKPEILVEKILAEKPDAVGITCLTAFYNEVIELAKLIKKNNIKCIIGGIHPTFLPHKTLIDSNADYVICGEGEIALLKLAKNNFVNNRIQGVYSIKDFENSKDIKIKKAETIKDLDKLPFPDWGQINPNKYNKAPHGAVIKNFPVAPLITTRGCPYECTFCASPNFCDRKIRFRTPKNIIKEIEYLIKNFGVKEIHFEDDNLTLKKEHIEKICHLIISKKIDINWACPNGVRSDKVDKKLIQLMKKSGCYCFAYGIESANPKILKNIKKNVTIETIKKSIEMADKEDMYCQGFFIFGLPGETQKTIQETIEFSKKSKLSKAVFGVLDILPGSELWYTLKGQFKPNWGKSSYNEPEWIPKGLTKEQLSKAQSNAYTQFYLRPAILFKFVKLMKLRQIGQLFQRLKELVIKT